eukprot:gene25806-biopygen8830
MEAPCVFTRVPKRRTKGHLWVASDTSLTVILGVNFDFSINNLSNTASELGPVGDLVSMITEVL